MKNMSKAGLILAMMWCCQIATAHPNNTSKTTAASPTNQKSVENLSNIVPFLAKYPTLREIDGQLDNYAYLLGKESQELFVKAIQDENRYTDSQIKQEIRQRLEKKMIKRSENYSQDSIWQDNGLFIKKTYDKSSHFYQYLYKNGDEWMLFSTPKSNSTAPKISPTKETFAIAEDRLGDENFTILVNDLKQKTNLSKIYNSNGDFVWFDDTHLLYVRNQQGNANQVYLHQVGQSQDKLIFDNVKSGFYVGLSTSSSGKYIIMTVNNLDSSEIYLLDKSTDDINPILVKSVKAKQEYYLDHISNGFIIRSNHEHKNFALYHADNLTNLQKQHWQTIFTPKEDETLESFMVQGDWKILKVRKQGLTQIYYKDDKTPLKSIDFFDENYMTWLLSGGFTDDLHLDNDILRLGYTSPTTPKTTLDYDLSKHTWLHSPTNVKNDYTIKRLFITGQDNAKIPVSLIYKTSLWQKGKNPLLVYGYGAYGQSMDMTYGSSYFSLLDKGFVYAIAHVRGGGELGENWHKSGQKFNKINSINDFISVTKSLQNMGFGNKGKTFAMGESAGGWLVANACIREPSLYQSCVLQVPFVDLVSGLSDDSQSSKAEFDEWGNPNNPKELANLKKISPYEIITPKSYPKFLVIANLHDVRTDARHALKFVAKLRDNQLNNDNPILLYTHSQGGHSGGYGRLSRIKNNALAYGLLVQP